MKHTIINTLHNLIDRIVAYIEARYVDNPDPHYFEEIRRTAGDLKLAVTIAFSGHSGATGEELDTQARLHDAAGMHNGWTNRETWQAYNHLSSTESIYDDCRHIANNEGFAAADTLRDYVDEKFGNKFGYGSPAGPWTSFSDDLTNQALNRIEWHELATAFKEE
jgi:hypothetical protein